MWPEVWPEFWPVIWADALATQGLWLLCLAAALAGVVRGFSGFGTGMIYVPLAAQVLPPIWVLITILIIDVLGPIPAMPRAIREGHPRDVLRLSFGALIALPLGVMVLVSLPVETFRYALTAVTLTLLVTLIAGYRYNGTVSAPMTVGIGGAGGFFAGAFGLPGPPVIFFYMARPLSPSVIRANVMLYLFVVDILMFGVFWARDMFEREPVLIGLLLIPIYGVSILIGTAIFDPSRETVYRWVAYGIIAVSAISGLPLWD